MFLVHFLAIYWCDLTGTYATQLQDDILRKAVETHKGKNWKKIGTFLADAKLICSLFSTCVVETVDFVLKYKC